MTFETIENIINGKFENLPDLNKKVVRIFVSSTFTDTNSERDHLIETVYPKLKQYCKSKYELDFQTVDMRWGVPSDSYENHGTTELCLNEIETCKALSIGPNFVAILGNKYGKRPLATKIEKQEFEILMNELAKDPISDFSLTLVDNNNSVLYNIDNLFKKCYRLDTNENPSHYRILPISQIINDYSSTDPQIKEIANKFWTSVETKLGELLRQGANLAFMNGHLSKQQLERYFVSTTEKEIFNGILKIKDANKSAFCFIREIDNIKSCINDKKAKKFIDIKKNISNPEIDIEAQKLLDDLKYNKIPSKLNQNNIFTYHVTWKDDSIENIEDSLKTFGEIFYYQIVRLVDEAMQSEYLLKESNYENFISKTHSGRTMDELKRVKENLKKLQTVNKHIEQESQENVDKLIEIRQEFKNLLHETVTHTTQYMETINKFFGRDDLMTKIESYILSDSNTPFVVTGESGCGKTNVMAMTAFMMPKWVPDPQNYAVIIRFLGTSIDSSTIDKTYSSIALQLHFLNAILMERNNFKDSVKQNLTSFEQYYKINDLVSLKSYLEEQLQRTHLIDPKKKIILILDSLDQLAPADYTNISQWILVDLPSHVKLIISTLSDRANLLDKVKTIIEKNYITQHSPKLTDSIEIKKNEISDQVNRHILKIDELNIDTSETILKNWLKGKQKHLSNDQWSAIRQMFQKANLLPLYVKLVFDIVLHWRSFDVPDEKFLSCIVIDDLILYLFRRMERLHGKTVFTRAICYMTVCKNGITESELEDILSLDDDVLFAVFQYHIPPVRRLPAILWLRIRNELHEYVVEREANDEKVIYWYHRRFIEVSLKQYVKDLKESEVIFQNILDFYNETWKDKQKPFKINDYLQHKLGLNNSEATGDRYISSQPIEYYGNDEQVHYNKRKLVELPNCLAKISSKIAIEKACELVFFNYEFMHAKFKCFGLSDIIEDLKNIKPNSAYDVDRTSYSNLRNKDKNVEQLKILEKIFMIAGDVIEDYPDSLAFQIVSRMVQFYGENKYLTHFIDQCDKHSIRHNAFVSPYVQLTQPGGTLRGSINRHYAPITHIILLMPLMISLSVKKIHVALLGGLYTLFQMNLPKLKDLSERVLENDAYKSFKVIVNRSEYNANSYTKEEYTNTTADNMPLTFVLISKYLTYLITSSKEVKFKYSSDRSSDHEILDVFCILNKIIVIVEKNSPSIKVFADYINHPTTYSEYQISEFPITNLCTSSYSIINTVDFHTWFYLHFSNNQIKKIVITDKSLKMVKLDEFDDIEGSASDSDSDYEYKENEYKAIFAGCPFTKLSSQINMYTFESLLPSNLDFKEIFIRSYDQAKVGRSYGMYSELNEIESHLYFYENGTFVISTIKQKSKKTMFYIFKDALKEPPKVIKYGAYSMFLISLLTENYSYMIHKTKTKKSDETYYKLKYFKDEEFCFVEFKTKYDSIVHLDDERFLAAGAGVIELNKLQCLKHSHRFHTILCVTAHNDTISNMLYFFGHVISTSHDGLLNLWQFKKSVIRNRLPEFERTEAKITKLIVSKKYAATITINNDVSFWELTNGKIIKSIQMNSIIKQLEFSRDGLYFVVLLQNFEVHFYDCENFAQISQITLKHDETSNFALIRNKNCALDKIEFHALDLVHAKMFNLTFKIDNKSVSSELVVGCDDTIDNNFDNYLAIHLEHINSILLINKNFKTYKVNHTKNETYKIEYDEKEDNENLNEYLATNKDFPFKYKVLNVNDDASIILFTIKFSNFPSIIIKAKTEKSNQHPHKIRFVIQKVYFGCENIFSNEKVVSYYINSQYTQAFKQKKRDVPSASKIIVRKFDTYGKYELVLDDSVEVHLICVDSNAEYVAFNDEKKLIHLYRLKDNKRIAILPLYDNGINMKFSLDDRFVCMTTNDRRIFCLLVVDPQVPEHSRRIKELPSRQLTEDKSKYVRTKTQILEKMGASSIGDSDELEIDSDVDENKHFDEEKSELDKEKTKPNIVIMKKMPIKPIYQVYKHNESEKSVDWINKIRNEDEINNNNNNETTNICSDKKIESEKEEKLNDNTKFFNELKASLVNTNSNANLFNRKSTVKITRNNIGGGGGKMSNSSACNIS